MDSEARQSVIEEKMEFAIIYHGFCACKRGPFEKESVTRNLQESAQRVFHHSKRIECES